MLLFVKFLKGKILQMEPRKEPALHFFKYPGFRFNPTKSITLIILIISIFSQNGFSESKKRETYKDIILKANNLSLQKDRAQAINLLVGAIKSETVLNKEKAELKNALQLISHLFYYDKSQQLYELSLSLRRTDITQALEKSMEALKIEPDNLSILCENARQLIIKKDCKSAEELLLSAKNLNPYDEQLNLSFAQSQICLGKTNVVLNTGIESKKNEISRQWSLLEIERLYQNKDYAKIITLLKDYKSMDRKNPEFYYWDWKVSSDKLSAQKYVINCKELSTHAFRTYLLDPMLCVRTNEVENYLKTTL